MRLLPARTLWMVVLAVFFALAAVPVNADGFSTWNALDSHTRKDLNAVWGADETVFAAGNSGVILYFDGSEWESLSSGVSADLKGIWGTAPDDVYVVGTAGTVLHYNGATWHAFGSDNTTVYNAVWGDERDVYAAGDAGVIHYYNGESWSSRISGTALDLYGIWGQGSEIFAVGEAGVITHFDGDSWSLMSSGVTESLRSVWGADTDDVYAVGDSSTLLHFNGSVWRSLSSGIAGDLYSVWGSDSTSVFIVGESGSIAFFDGDDFSAMNRDTLNDLRSVWGFSGINVFAVGRSGTILRYLPPQIDSLSQDQGDQGAVMDLTLYGRNLDEVSEVSLGSGIAVNSLEILNSKMVRVNLKIISGAATGFRDVTVTSSGGSYTLPDSFIVNEASPVISGVSPDLVRQGAVLSVTLTGSHLTNVTAVSLGQGIAVSDFSTLSANQLSLNISVAADAAAGSRDVSVVTAGGSFTLSAGFTVQQAVPELAAVTPARGNQAETLTLTLNGANLNGVTAVEFGSGVTVNNIGAVNSSQLTVEITITAEAVTGSRDVSITTPGGSVTLPSGFEVIQALPVIESISPDYGNKGAAVNITITGLNLDGATELRLGSGIAINSFSVLSSTRISAGITVVAGTDTGSRDVTVTTPGGISVLTNGFTVKAGLPVISSISPENGAQGEALELIISGSNLDGATAVSLGPGVLVESFSNLSATQIQVKLQVESEAVIGVRDVSVTTPGGSSTLGSKFSVTEKSLGVLLIILIWVGVALVAGVFVLVLNILRKKRAVRIQNG